MRLCSKHSVQWRPNMDEVVIFGARTSHSLARSLSPPSASPLPSPHLTSTQLNAIHLNQSINQSDYSHIHSRINLGLHSLIHTLLHSLIHSHNFTPPLPHLIVPAFQYSPTDSPIHSFAQKFARSQLFTPSRNNPIIHSLPHSFKYSHIIQLFLHSPNY